eukprot:tig00021579_g22441.t1
MEQLPDGLLSRVVELLGPQDAWRARGVCRRWRAAVDGVEWRALPLAFERATQVEALAGLVRRRRLLLAPGAALQLTYTLEGCGSGGAEEPLAADLWVSSGALSRAGVGLLAACWTATAGGLGEVAVEGSAPVGPVCTWRPTVEDALTLRALLAAFAGLERLELGGPGLCVLDAVAAAALAEAAPRLRRLEASFAEDVALGALAPSPPPGAAAERPRGGPLRRRPRPPRRGAAGRALRRLRLAGHGRDAFFSPPGFIEECSEGDVLQLAALPLLRCADLSVRRASTLRGLAAALPRLPALDSLGLYLDLDGIPGSDLGAVLELLAAAARPLRRLLLQSARPLRADVARAIAACPRLAALSIDALDIAAYDELAGVAAPAFTIVAEQRLARYAAPVLQGRLPRATVLP